MSEKANTRGGAREGAGRPKGTTKAEGIRKQRQLRAYDDEWELVKEFNKLLKSNKDKAEELLSKLR